MGVACGAHVLHDGYTDLLYVLLPIWQAQFGLGYAEVGALRALVHRLDGEPAGAGRDAGRADRRASRARARHGAGRGRISRGWGQRRIRHAGGGPGAGRDRRRRAAPDRGPSRRAGVFRKALAHRARQLQFLGRSRQDGVSGDDRGSRRADAVAERDIAARRPCARRRRGDPERARSAGSRQLAGRRCRENFRDRATCRERARVSAAAVDRDDRQRDADGVSDLSAVSAEAEGRRPADDRYRADPGLYRRRRRQAGLRLARRAARGSEGGVSDRGLDRCRDRRAAAAAAVRRRSWCCR